MAFRISRGIWQFQKEDGTYESRYKIATDGRLVTTDTLGNEISTFGGTASWDSITGKPSTFTPSAHTHDDRYYTETEVNTLLAGKQAAGSYAAASHTHDDRYLVKGGSWYGVNLPGSRWGGYSVNGGEIVFGRDLPNNGQMGMLIDGAYLAGENNGFWSLPSNNDWGGRRGMYYDGTYLNLTTNTPTTRVSSLLSDGTITMASISGTDQMVENTYGAYLHLGGWGVGRTDASAVLVNTAYRADYATSLFDMNISRFTNNSGYLTNGSSEIITYVYRIHASDGTSPDNFGYNNRYQTFNYGVSSGITGPLLTFGGLGDSYPMQITGAYSGGGNAFAVRTRNGDTGVWNSWRTLITDGNIGSQSVNYAASAGAVAWGNVSGKPSTFTPSSHTHAISEVTGLQSALDGKQAAGSYAAASHTHTIANVTGLQSALDGKQAAGSYAAASHTHAISDVTGLQTALDGKQAAGSYAASNHNHTYNVNDNWLRENGDNANFKIYGNSRQVAFRTDGTTEYASGVGGYAFAWMYGGDAASNRRMLLASDGRLWTSYHGWMDEAFQPKGSYAASSHTHTIANVTGLQAALDGKQAAGSYLTTSGKAADSELLDGLNSSVFVRNDIYNSANSGLQVFRNIGSNNGSWQDANHTFGLENSDNGNIVFNFHRAGYTSHNLLYNGSQFRFDQVVASTADMRAPIFYDSENTGYYLDPASRSNLNMLTLSGAGHFFPNSWIEFSGYYGLYSPYNGAHFYPNNASYGSWRVAGSRNGYNGLEFDSGNGQVSLMIRTNSNITGFHNNSYGWQFYWEGGTLYCYKSSYGGGTSAVVLDSSNWPNYVAVGDARWKTDQYNPLGIYLDPQNSFTEPTQGYAYFSNEYSEIRNSSGGFGVRDTSSDVGSLWVNSGGQWNYGTFLSLGYYNWNATTAQISFGWNNGIKWDSQNKTGEFYASASEAKLLINSNGEFHMYLNYSEYGYVYAAEFFAMSDASLKINVAPISNALDKVKALNGVSFHWKKDNKRDFGFIAQEVEQVIPELVSESQQGKAVNYAKTVAILTEAIKEQQTIIEQLMARIDALESK